MALFKKRSSKVIFFRTPDVGSDKITSSFKSVTASKPVIAKVLIGDAAIVVAGWVKAPPNSTSGSSGLVELIERPFEAFKLMLLKMVIQFNPLYTSILLYARLKT